MTSVNPINGSNSTFKQFIINSAIPGGAIKGYMPPTTLLTDKRYNEYEQIRATLKNSWNTSYPSQLRQNMRILAKERYLRIIANNPSLKGFERGWMSRASW